METLLYLSAWLIIVILGYNDGKKKMDAVRRSGKGHKIDNIFDFRNR